MRKTNFIFLSIILITQALSVYAQGFPGARGGGDPFSEMDKAFNDQERTLTPEEEYYLGRAVAANILTAYKPYVSNAALTRYLNNICQVLAVNSSMPEPFNGYCVMILDSQEFNAFATPGGHIFITKGLVESASSEDVLAAIIAHELGHIMLKHGLSMIDSMKLMDDLDSVARQSAAVAGKGNEEIQRNLAFRNSISEMLDALIKSGYSQTQEFEADNAALTLLSDAGYDPRGLLEALGVLQRAQRSQQGGLFNTHPDPSDRIAVVRQLAAGVVSPNTQPSRKERFTRTTGKR